MLTVFKNKLNEKRGGGVAGTGPPPIETVA